MNNNIDKINSFLVSNYCVARGKLQAQNDTKLSCHHYMFYSRLASIFFFFQNSCHSTAVVSYISV